MPTLCARLSTASQKSVREASHLLLLVDWTKQRRKSTTEFIGDNGGVLTTAVANGRGGAPAGAEYRVRLRCGHIAAWTDMTVAGTR